jgi:ornithine decarboxylase
MKNQISEPPGARLALQPLGRRAKIAPLQQLPLNEQPSLPVSQEEISPARIYRSVDDMVHDMRPEMSVQCLRPATIIATAKRFLKAFPGDVMYAVKTNPDRRVLQYLSRAGVTHYDVASLAEVKLVADTLPGAEMHFMHPIKSREAIAAAYEEYGVRDFSLDSHEELQKILDVTKNATDLGLYVRLAIASDGAAYSLAGKFGVALNEAVSLLKASRDAAARVGVCFHVGSQCMNPDAYIAAVQKVAALVAEADIRIDVLDIGGGFPSIYPGMTPPPLGYYMRAIKKALKLHPELAECQLICEPGRALVAEGGSVVVRVEARKGNMLYINDGTFGSLFDAGYPGFVFPVKTIRPAGALSAETAEFGFFGPTCDSLDVMKGPFQLPKDIAEGDWIEIGQLGAYGATLRTNFNGFYSDLTVEVADKPILSMIGVH